MKLTKKQAQQYSIHLVRDGKLVAIFLVGAYQAKENPILAPLKLGKAVIKAMETHAEMRKGGAKLNIEGKRSGRGGQ